MAAPTTTLSSEELHQLVTSKLDCPVVFRQFLHRDPKTETWQIIKWTTNEWSNLLKDTPLKVRMGLRKSNSTHPQWESTCLTSFMNFEQLVNWDKGGQKCVTNNRDEVSSETHWAYYDYIYMKEEVSLDALKSQVSWEPFGFHGRGTDDSTIWVGTSGASTACHMDTFGCNLVAQVLGRKRWTLFPPHQMEALYPTRVPYEESSVYSKIDFTNISAERYPKIKESTPFVVTLEPGDVLFVPKHWWHFVESLTFSISINTWIELPSDKIDQLKEALVLHQVGSVCQAVDSPSVMGELLNPNMLHVASLTPPDLLDCVQVRLDPGRRWLQQLNARSETADLKVDSKETGDCRGKSDHDGDVEQLFYSKDNNITKILPLSFADYADKIVQPSCGFAVAHISAPAEASESNSSETLARLLMESLTDPRVINLLTEVMLEKLQMEETRSQN